MDNTQTPLQPLTTTIPQATPVSQTVPPPPPPPPPPPIQTTPSSFQPPAPTTTTTNTAPTFVVPAPEEKITLPFFSFNFYQQILKGERKINIFVLILIISIITAITPVIFLLKTAYPLVNNIQEKGKSFIEENYPSELEIKIKNGNVSTNVPEPYYLTVSKKSLNFLDNSTQKSLSDVKIRLLAIDTKGKADDFDRYQSYALLTGTSLVYYNDQKVNIQSLRNIQNLTINKEFIDSKVASISRPIKELSKVFTVITPFLVLIGIFISNLFNLLFLAFLIFLINKIIRTPFNFSKIYEFTAPLWFVPTFFLSLVSLIPFLSFLTTFKTLFTMIILGLAYTILVKNVSTTNANNN